MRTKKFSPRQVSQMTRLTYGQIIRRIRARKLIAEKVDHALVITEKELKRFARHEGIELS